MRSLRSGLGGGGDSTITEDGRDAVCGDDGNGGGSCGCPGPEEEWRRRRERECGEHPDDVVDDDIVERGLRGRAGDCGEALLRRAVSGRPSYLCASSSAAFPTKSLP